MSPLHRLRSCRQHLILVSAANVSPVVSPVCCPGHHLCQLLCSQWRRHCRQVLAVRLLSKPDKFATPRIALLRLDIKLQAQGKKLVLPLGLLVCSNLYSALTTQHRRLMIKQLVLDLFWHLYFSSSGDTGERYQKLCHVLHGVG